MFLRMIDMQIIHFTHIDIQRIVALAVNRPPRNHGVIAMLEAYREHTRERGQQGIPPLALNAAQVAELVELVKNPPVGEEAYILDLLTNNVPPGVDDAAYVKAAFLADVAKGSASSPILDRKRATELLGTMVGGYNIESLVALLDDTDLAETAATALRGTLLMFDAFHDVAEKAKGGNAHAQAILEAWANAEWFTKRDEVPDAITLTVFKVPAKPTRTTCPRQLKRGHVQTFHYTQRHA